jgi:hypothetical protein
MELPITRPTQMSYADEIDFSELLGNLKSKRFNGFIRVTSGPSDGYILFNEGRQSASSFGSYSKKEAIEQIKSIVDDSKTLIEVFDLKKSQMNYLMELNKFFIIDNDSKVDSIIGELKKTEYRAETEIKEAQSPVNEIKETEKAEEVIIADEPKKISEAEKTENKGEEVISKIGVTPTTISEPSADEKAPVEVTAEPEILSTPNEDNKEKSEEAKAVKVEKVNEEKKPEPEIEKPQYPEENEFVEPGFEAESVDRDQLIKKYGLKDVGEQEVDNILETYKGGSLSDEDVEKIELTLMNKIKKSILGIPKIKGTEVMVFLDNNAELSGTINMIIEYESKGLLSKIMGESKDIDNLRRQIINITQIEVKKSFRGYPEIIDDFEINVEIS